MNISGQIIGRQTDRVRRLFERWRAYMEERVVFWDIPGEFDIHTQGHCERVLLHALRIGEARGADDRSMEALAHAAIFHDTRRRDNHLDVGHGGRAALYYRDHCAATGLAFLSEACLAMRFHDRDDALGEQVIGREGGAEAARWVEVYRCFKDADALDRLRLGTWCLDVRFLRTPEARGMVAFAQQLVEQTTDPAELSRMYAAMEAYRERYERGGE